MLVPTSRFFRMLCIHHKLKPEQRAADLRGRLAATIRIPNTDEVTRRCLELFIKRKQSHEARRPATSDVA